ncbi:dihydrofolate reductase family protein [Nonomuraea sp. NPDC050790]|uniref:dihydrofolate reductase family protein n=1 Tax=Nonomuraea sp. NPDC050790 TaxID=3364371 RepID=UPI0037A70C27
MSKIINSTFVSVDGVVNHMDAWHFAYIDEESNDITLEQLSAATALLMGRATYDVYAGAWPERDGAYADAINHLRKYVASTTLRSAHWHNSTIITDLIPAVEKLKHQDEGDILMHGFGPVARTLMRHGLLDELHLWVHPRFAGVGGPGDMLLSEGDNTALELTGTRALRSGVVILSYRVADAP